MSPPFLILAAPRSRTNWISKFLSYGAWYCGHEQLLFARSLGDVRSWLSMNQVGSAETGAMWHWRLAKHLRPDLRLITIRRESKEILDSLGRIGLPVPFRYRADLLEADVLRQPWTNCEQFLSGVAFAQKIVCGKSGQNHLA